MTRPSNNNDLYQLAENNGTVVICENLPTITSASAMTLSGNTYIGIDPFGIDSTAEERVHLAHELGHCTTGSFYNAYSKYDVRQKAEYSADKWAIKKLVPLDELKEVCLNGYNEIWQIAEYFNITEDFVKKAVDYYENELFDYPYQ